ncbi:hypothetical protein IMZ48_19780 [Candidatus Bathyarchaeota archaeon]|nr:hypothetical protein [Candidatus Bathyarchaeota archaeon]
MRCSRCTALELQELVDLAKINSDKEHHTSIHDLERSAHEGCDLCGLIIRAFAESTSSEDRYWTRDEGTLLDVIKTWRDESSIRISIQADHYTGGNVKNIRNLDLLQVTAGTAGEYDAVEDLSGDMPPAVCLLLSSPSRSCPQGGP